MAAGGRHRRTHGALVVGQGQGAAIQLWSSAVQPIVDPAALVVGQGGQPGRLGGLPLRLRQVKAHDFAGAGHRVDAKGNAAAIARYAKGLAGVAKICQSTGLQVGSRLRHPSPGRIGCRIHQAAVGQGMQSGDAVARQGAVARRATALVTPLTKTVLTVRAAPGSGSVQQLAVTRPGECAKAATVEAAGVGCVGFGQ